MGRPHEQLRHRFRIQCALVPIAPGTRAFVVWRFRAAALERALLSGKLGGYAVDVYEHEPPTLSKAFSLPNVLTTPHIGSSTFETNRRMGDMVVDNIIAFKDGHEPPNKVNPMDRVRFS